MAWWGENQTKWARSQATHGRCPSRSASGERGGRNRKENRQHAASALDAFALHADRSAMELDELSRQGEAQPRPALLAGVRRVDLLERIKNPGLILGLDTNPGVRDHDPQRTRRALAGRQRFTG